MMKLTTLVLLVLCGAAVSHGDIIVPTPVILPMPPKCPPFLQDLVVKCALDVGLHFPTRLDCKCPVLECLVKRVIDFFGLDIRTTQFNRTPYVNVLIKAGVSPKAVDKCLVRVGGLVTGGKDLLDCHLALDGALILCLLENLGCLL